MGRFTDFLFGRRSQAETGTPSPPSTPSLSTKGTFSARPNGSGQTVTYVRSELPSMRIEDAYGYGQVDGRAGTSSEHYRAYVGWTLEEERLQQLLREADERLQRAENRYVHTRDLLPTIAARTQEQQRAERHASTLQEELGQVEQAVERVEAERKQKATRGSLFSGTLYLSVAIVFVLADVIVARQIVADALKFTKGELFGINESWLFAIGLAMISVLLKPVYDRLVEEKYLDGTGRRTYAWVMIAVSFFALITLFIMGAFRSEAFALQSQIDALIRANGDPAEIRRLGDTLAASRLGGWANVLSGMLFAVAGAVSLGMGSRHFQDFWQIRRRLARESAKLQTRREAIRSEIRQVLDQIGNKASEINRLTVEWLESPGLPHVARERDLRRRERDELLAQAKAAARHKIASVYQDGYNLGYIGQENAEELRKHRRPYLSLRRALRLTQMRGFVRAEEAEANPPDPAPPPYTGGRSTPVDTAGVWSAGARHYDSPAGSRAAVDVVPVPKIVSEQGTIEPSSAAAEPASAAVPDAAAADAPGAETIDTAPQASHEVREHPAEAQDSAAAASPETPEPGEGPSAEPEPDEDEPR